MKSKILEKWSKLDKIDKLLLVLLVVSFLIRIVSVFYPFARGWDETVYLNLGKDLSSNPLLYSLKNSNWNDFIPSSDLIYSWPNIGFRAPLLPYIFSIFYYLKLDFLIPLIIPILATASVFLVYVLGKELFSKKVGLFSAILFSLMPIHVFCSGRIWVDAFTLFFVLLTFISFWKGYEKENKKYKVLFGLFFALSILARYTAMWLCPVFLLYFLIRDKSLKFLKDKYLWLAIGLFLIIFIPWLIYGQVYYGNPLGSFIHGLKASTYYGGVQSWNYFFVNFWRIFSMTGIVSILALIFVLFKKEFIKREVYLLLIWGIFFSLMVISMPHKEDRYILTVIPVICLLSGLFIDRLGKYKNIILGLVCLASIFTLWQMSLLGQTIIKDPINICFFESNKFLASEAFPKNSLIMTNQSPIVHYQTGKKTVFYPDTLNVDSIKSNINSNYRGEEVYIFFTNFDMPKENEIKNYLGNNFEKVFECSKTSGYSAIYKYE
jgi:4-amino-4-deoxy-L-arabinose transferase-like glycosyltransferase